MTLEAAAAAQRVEGVKRVHNHLMVQLPADDYRDDAQLTTAANNALAWDVTVPPGVEATARDGNVTLTGTVHFGSERTAAETAVSHHRLIARDPLAEIGYWRRE
jgi:osmotically-inducible protein OsmY